MHLNFHVISNTPHEIAMGHKIWFEPVPGCDVISATANAPGFTPLIAVARHFGWDYDMLERAAAACNAKGEVLILTSVVPTLVLVPATKGRGKADAIVDDCSNKPWGLVRPACQDKRPNHQETRGSWPGYGRFANLWPWA